MPWIERGEGPPTPAAAACTCDPEMEAFVGDLVANWPDARIKMFVMACALRLRRRDPTLFIESGYQPLRAEGAHAAHVVAFCRTLQEKTLVAVVPRLMNYGLPGDSRIPVGSEVWSDTRVFLPADTAESIYQHAFTTASLRPDENGSFLAADLFRTCPVALLVSDST